MLQTSTIDSLKYLYTFFVTTRSAKETKKYRYTCCLTFKPGKYAVENGRRVVLAQHADRKNRRLKLCRNVASPR